jgi:hypothetical protein
MKKIIFIILFLFLIGCDTNYKTNGYINRRTPPVVVIAIDTATSSVVLRDGDNKVFTIYDNPTSKSITSSLSIGDTVRIKEKDDTLVIEKF